MVRKRTAYDPQSGRPYPLSRSGVEEFLKCKRCFYLHQKHGIAAPGGAPQVLNLAVDTLLKREFDVYRQRKAPHPLMVEAGVNAVPYACPQLGEWRNRLCRMSPFVACRDMEPKRLKTRRGVGI